MAVGRPRVGPGCELKKYTDRQFKCTVRHTKVKENTMRADSSAQKLLQNDVQDFWREVGIINASKVPLSSSIEGVTGPENIVKKA